jgi:hypothetical protein
VLSLLGYRAVLAAKCLPTFRKAVVRRKQEVADLLCGSFETSVTTNRHGVKFQMILNLQQLLSRAYKYGPVTDRARTVLSPLIRPRWSVPETVRVDDVLFVLS